MALDELDDQLLPGGTLLVVFTLGRGTARARAGASSSSVEIMAEECWRAEARAATAVVSDRARDQCSVLSAQWALEPGEGVNPALGTWPPVDSGLVVVAAKY